MHRRRHGYLDDPGANLATAANLKIAGRWFERRAISHGVTWLWEPHVDSFLRCNIWHVRGRDRDLIIDTGSGVASLRNAIVDLLDKPAIAAATHIHYDHVGGLHEFDARLMHRIEAPRMNPYREFHPLRVSAFPPSFRDYFSARDPKRSDLLIDAIPAAGWNPEDYTITSTAPTRLLDEGDSIDLGDRAFEVMHLPGHSPGSIGLWEKSSGILFSGDAIYDGALLDNLPDSSILDYIRTMKRLRALPVAIVHGGHEPSFGRGRMIVIADKYLAAHGA